jgi:hypothetical protein
VVVDGMPHLVHTCPSLPALVAVDRLSPPGDVWPPGGLGRSGRLVHCRLTRGLREGVTRYEAASSSAQACTTVARSVEFVPSTASCTRLVASASCRGVVRWVIQPGRAPQR